MFDHLVDTLDVARIPREGNTPRAAGMRGLAGTLGGDVVNQNVRAAGGGSLCNGTTYPGAGSGYEKRLTFKGIRRSAEVVCKVTQDTALNPTAVCAPAWRYARHDRRAYFPVVG